MKLDEVAKNYDRVAKRYDTWTDLIFERLLCLERYREQIIRLLGDIEDATAHRHRFR